MGRDYSRPKSKSGRKVCCAFPSYQTLPLLTCTAVGLQLTLLFLVDPCAFQHRFSPTIRLVKFSGLITPSRRRADFETSLSSPTTWTPVRYQALRVNTEPMRDEKWLAEVSQAAARRKNRAILWAAPCGSHPLSHTLAGYVSAGLLRGLYYVRTVIVTVTLTVPGLLP
ncbi:hypothetical protein BKA59DRAFT_155418 [Fusarium tricinctum]|uniref:Uncharacterized protein n=1 Tax=Fusarium tricinctum TaxID=61284 RepID=A0A8K0S383_9HYPO|nr:hypothetical protein BKA59DRAFT_155418 [Fusarium tricinctum]